MAIKKEIISDNGVNLNYHRVSSITSLTNISTTIEISSYTNESKRLEEKKYQKLQMKQDRTIEEEQELEKGINVYIDSDYIEIPYSEDFDIKKAYQCLKTLDKYKDAVDI